MSRIRSKNTTPERLLCSALRGDGLYFARHAKELPGKPDVVFRRIKLAVFVDGTFWHGWRFPAWEAELKPYWRKKIGGNRARDKRNFAKLRRLGWAVIRIWEHDITKDLDGCLMRVKAQVTFLRKSAAANSRGVRKA
jgi:DNA mismatch endonuclease (patch repair protein)